MTIANMQLTFGNQGIAAPQNSARTWHFFAAVRMGHCFEFPAVPALATAGSCAAVRRIPDMAYFIARIKSPPRSIRTHFATKRQFGAGSQDLPW
jgi:hypothetical protein